jgi:hypothetical protein
MTEAANDNTDTWISLAALTANVVRYLQPNEKQNEEGKRDPAPSGADEKKRAEECKYIEQRLKDIRAFERRAGRLGKN